MRGAVGKGMDWFEWPAMPSFVISALSVVASVIILFARDVKELRREQYRFGVSTLLIATTLIALALGAFRALGHYLTH